MQRTLYLRPVGLYPTPRDEREDTVWGGLPLTGGPLAFSALEVIERKPAGGSIRRVIGIG